MIGSLKVLEQKRDECGLEPPKISQNPIFQSLYFRILGSVLSGILLALAFPGFGNATLAFAAFVPLMYAVQSTSTKQAGWLGLLAGFVFFMVSLSWLHNLTGEVEGVGLKISALLGYAFLAVYCALYFIPFALVSSLGTQRWVGRNLGKNVCFMFALTMVWVGSEYVRGCLFTGFPWNPLGVSQYASPAINQIAAWGGVYIVSAYIVWMNTGLFITIRQYTHGTRSKKYRPHFELMIGLLPLALSITYGIKVLYNRPVLHESVNVSLVQPNIEQSVKWDNAKDQEIRDRLEELTRVTAGQPNLDLVVWPETAVPDFVFNSQRSYGLVRRMAALGAPMLVGSMDYEISDSGVKYFNSSILFDVDGSEVGKYDKQHLVPFGEYVPFPRLMRKFTPIDVDFGHGNGSTVLPLYGKAPFSVLICFEDTVPPLAANAVKAGARWLVNQTNDAWFDPSAQSEQHMAHAVFRCVENRVPMARCCNTGVTCLIDAYGLVQRSLAVRTPGVASGTLTPRPVGLKYTFYTRHGDLFAKVALFSGVIAIISLRPKGWTIRRKRTS